MSAAGEVLTSGSYIKHHLQNLTYGRLSDGSWGLAHNAAEAKDMGFWAFHVDTLGFSFVLGAAFLFLFYRVGKTMTTETPSGVQNFIESIVDFINENVRGSFNGKNMMVAPLKEPLTFSLIKSTILSMKFCTPEGVSVVIVLPTR
jgi:F-type H+-transporting ATPase subunit a